MTRSIPAWPALVAALLTLACGGDDPTNAMTTADTGPTDPGPTIGNLRVTVTTSGAMPDPRPGPTTAKKVPMTVTVTAMAKAKAKAMERVTATVATVKPRTTRRQTPTMMSP